MGRESVERPPPTVHVAAWDPASNGRGWDSKILKLDAYSSRIKPSGQRRRDGAFVADRTEKLLSAYPHSTVAEQMLGGHPQLLRDGSPRGQPDHLPVWKWDHPTEYMSTHRMFYNKNNFAGGSELKRPDRHAGAMPSRVSPNIYNSVFGREYNEPAGSPRAMPSHSFVRSRGGAHVPTESHWADPPLVSVAPALPSQQTEDDKFRIQLIEAQLRSEARMQRATLALTLDKIEANNGAMTARF